MSSPLFKAGIFALSSIISVAAQQPTAQQEPIRTLHVYTDLIQIPTLVLAGNHDPLKTPLPENSFSVSIDSGPWFRVTHVRPEGNDPLSISILLDTSGATANLLPRVNDAIAALAPSSLSVRDHVSIYVLDCVLTRTLSDAPAENEHLKLATDQALSSWTIRKQNRQTSSNCKQSVHLWDAMGFVATELSKLPGRRVMLVITDGRDKGSKLSWNNVRAFTQAQGVAVFGMTNTAVAFGWNRLTWINQSDANAFQTICELSGGMLMPTSPDSIAKTFKQSIAMLRARYIVEFPRPANSTKGEHDMRIKIARSGDDYIRPSGISIPIQDPTLMADPTTVPSDPSHAPQQGKRPILPMPR